MASSSQARAVDNYRKRLNRRGMARFEVLGLKKDRELVRAVARKLAAGTPEAEQMRMSISKRFAEKAGKKGGVLKMLRNAPPGFAELNLTREWVEPRKVDL